MRKGKKPKPLPLSRSEMMARIKGKDTVPELLVRRAVWAAGLRYRLHDRRLPGRPDLVFPGRRVAVFVHGCFWHCHEGCNRFRIPKTRTDWWTAKLGRNKARDDEVRAAIEASGWEVIVIWECEAERPERLSELVGELKALTSVSARKRFPLNSASET
ncbi:very short patch repair endonuclease [Azospirillum argentinense]|uniref:Very short patch repair endonuclease n=2 Tax=Azospirillum argentinense TaxID=2970906 RepID=A0A2K1FUJ0_9PROT|nr:very short patch repair endonuclease [Azospirillum argentinense]PNQ96190.1 very short patch repair endonuclease [Azospirillum argentinense]